MPCCIIYIYILNQKSPYLLTHQPGQPENHRLPGPSVHRVRLSYAGWRRNGVASGVPEVGGREVAIV